MSDTKSRILEILKNSEEFVSGEVLAEKCGVSRMAVNKAVASLRDSGYEIGASTKKGYVFVSPPDPISAEKILNIIKEYGIEDAKVLAFDSIDSTNAEAKRRISEIGSFRDVGGELTEGGRTLHKALFVSGEQTAGRGRMGRSFASPPNSGVYFTFVYTPKGGVENPAFLTAGAAVAVCEAIDEICGFSQTSVGNSVENSVENSVGGKKIRSQIKWVNDVFLTDGEKSKKVCGILTEGTANFETGRVEAAVVGIGINVRRSNFPGALSKVAGSLDEFSEKRVSRCELAARVASKIAKFYDSLENRDENSQESARKMIREYRKRSLLIGKTVTVNPTAGLSGKSFRATVEDISEDAELVVKCEDGGKKFLKSGEVSLGSGDFV